jgi:hypothetical protein
VAEGGGGGGNVTRYATPFKLPPIGLAPHVEPLHVLYIYPLAADLSSTSARNVMCQITLRRSDETPLPTEQPAVFDATGPFVSVVRL